MKKFLVTVFISSLFCNIAYAQSSLPECGGSPYEIKKFSLTGGGLATKAKMLAKWRNCHGTLINKDGSQYVGEFQGGKYSGQGTFTWGDGEFAGDKYVGEFLKGKRSGIGTYTFSNGDVDHGIWAKGKLIERIEIGKKKAKKEEAKVAKKKEAKVAQKEPTQTESSLFECEGSPLEVKTFSFSGMKMFAKWRNCQGTLFGKDGSKYVGEFQGGKFSGQGIYTYNDGSIYKGGFKRGKSEGLGTYKFANGDLYVGEFKSDSFHGQGTFTNRLGGKYEGEFAQGVYNGQGTFTFPDGRENIGTWLNGLLDGEVNLFLEDGGKYFGLYKNGERNGQGSWT